MYNIHLCFHNGRLLKYVTKQAETQAAMYRTQSDYLFIHGNGYHGNTGRLT